MSHRPPSFSMPPPPRPIDTSWSAMQSRVDELEKIKHHGISGMVQSIQDELRKTGEQDWEMMVSETDARGVLLERRICQELVAVQKDVRQLVTLRATVKEFRTILIRHSASLSFKPLRAVIQNLSSSSLPEVECLKISLLSLRINDIETSRETNDPDGKILNTVQHFLAELNADLRLANQKTQEQGLHHEKEVAQLNETIRNTVKKISDLLWKALGGAWFNTWNKTVKRLGSSKSLLLLPENDPRISPASHSLARSRLAFTPVRRRHFDRTF